MATQTTRKKSLPKMHEFNFVSYHAVDLGSEYGSGVSAEVAALAVISQQSSIRVMLFPWIAYCTRCGKGSHSTTCNNSLIAKLPNAPLFLYLGLLL